MRPLLTTACIIAGMAILAYGLHAAGTPLWVSIAVGVLWPLTLLAFSAAAVWSMGRGI